MNTTLTRRHALTLGSGALLLPSMARAADWPSGPVTLVVGYAAGGGADINARELAQIMSPMIGQQVIVDNKGGAAGSVGVRGVASAKPDGQTLFYAVSTNVIINPHVQKGMIDTIATLAPICQTTSYQYVLAGNPKVAANTTAELVALAKKEPEKLTFSSSGVGGNNHLAGALFAELKKHFSEGQIVELTAAIAMENFRSKFNPPLGIEAQGFCMVAKKP